MKKIGLLFFCLYLSLTSNYTSATDFSKVDFSLDEFKHTKSESVQPINMDNEIPTSMSKFAFGRRINSQRYTTSGGTRFISRDVMQSALFHTGIHREKVTQTKISETEMQVIIEDWITKNPSYLTWPTATVCVAIIGYAAYIIMNWDKQKNNSSDINSETK